MSNNNHTQTLLVGLLALGALGGGFYIFSSDSAEQPQQLQAEMVVPSQSVEQTKALSEPVVQDEKRSEEKPAKKVEAPTKTVQVPVDDSPIDESEEKTRDVAATPLKSADLDTPHPKVKLVEKKEPQMDDGLAEIPTARKPTHSAADDVFGPVSEPIVDRREIGRRQREVNSQLNSLLDALANE